MSNADKRDTVMRVLELWSEFLEELSEEVEQQARRECVSYRVDHGHYPAKLETPDGGVFDVGPAYVWGNRFDGKQNVDLFIHRVPEVYRDSGLGECELTIYTDDGVPLLSGELKDDGNRQDGLNSICVAIVPDTK